MPRGEATERSLVMATSRSWLAIATRRRSPLPLPTPFYLPPNDMAIFQNNGITYYSGFIIAMYYLLIKADDQFVPMLQTAIQLLLLLLCLCALYLVDLAQQRLCLSF